MSCIKGKGGYERHLLHFIIQRGKNLVCLLLTSLRNLHFAVFNFPYIDITYIAQIIPLCIPITLNNPLKACFLNKKYPITTQTRPTQIVKVNFLLKTWFLTNFKDYYFTKLITYHFLFRFSVQELRH